MNNGPNLTTIERSTLERIRQIQRDEQLSRRESTVSTLSNLSLDTIATTGRLLDHLGLESLVGSDDGDTDEEDNLSIVYDDESKINLAKSQTNSSTSTLKDTSFSKQRDDEHERDTAKNNYVSAQNFRSLKQRFHTPESLTNKIDLSTWKDAQVLESASHPTQISNNSYLEHRVSCKPEPRQDDSDHSSGSPDEHVSEYDRSSKTSTPFSHEKSQSQTITHSWHMTEPTEMHSSTEPDIESPRRKRFTVFGTDSSSYIPSPPRIRSPLFKRLSNQVGKDPGQLSSPKKNALNLSVHHTERDTLARYLDSNDIDYTTIPKLPAAVTTQLKINPHDLPSPTQRNFHKHSNSYSSLNSQDTTNLDRVSLALKLRNSGKLKESSYQLEKASHEGNEQAMLLYALALRYGDGVRKDNLLSLQWLMKIFLAYFQSLPSFLREAEISPFALDSTNVPSSPKEPISSALYELGKCYMTGLGVNKDEATGLKFLEKAASMGIVDAMCEVGMIWSSKSKHRKKDLYKASAWLRLADKFHAPLVGVSWIYKEKYFHK